MEDLPVKAIIIGVSVFVTMAVLSAIIIYYNTARSVADTISNRIDIASTYDSIMNEDNFEANLTGVEVRSLITKYVGNENVIINIVEVSGIETNKYRNVNNNWINKANVISEEKLDLINPIWNCEVKKEVKIVNSVENTTRTTLNISLDAEK